jgi:uncharacterized circularly permuted ATP-grasp superfamily protein
VDVIYRRVDDDFLDPLVFRPTSTLGCAGLLGVYRSGNVAICNAVGTGVADDKSIYPYVPKMIEFYLGQKPILSNVPTFMGRNPEDLKYMLAHMEELVVKEVHGAGGYGMLVGPASTKAEVEEFRAGGLAKPDGYIAQPTLSLSTCPTYVESGVAPRHIDLRPFVLSGKEVQMVPGGLTRVALKNGSLVVNSSQGGGTKDTWVLEDGPLNAPPRRFASPPQGGGTRGPAKPVPRCHWNESPHALRSWRFLPELLKCCHAPPTTCSGCPATPSAPKTPRACSTSTTRPRCCRSRLRWHRWAGKACWSSAS